MRRRPRKQTGVPRRFGIGAMMVITTMYAVLFAVLQCAPPDLFSTLAMLFSYRRPSAAAAETARIVLFATVAMFVTVVGVSQAVLFKGRNPRRASILTGMVLGLLITAVVAVLRWRYWGYGSINLTWRWIVLFIVSTILSAICGAIAGYLAGGATAGVFLLLNKVQPPLDAEEPPQGRK